MPPVASLEGYLDAQVRVFHRFERPAYLQGERMVVAASHNAIERDARARSGDILFIQGYPGVQNVQTLYRALLQHDLSVCLPIWRGVEQRYLGTKTPLKGEVRFSQSAHELHHVLDWWSASRVPGAPRVLGGYSLGSLIAPSLAAAHEDQVDALFVLGGMFGAKDMFDGNVYSYKGIRGWDGWRAYMRDCMGPRCAVRNVGDPDKAFEDFKALVERGPEIGEVISGLHMPVAIVHSPSDTVFPYSHAQKYFPPNALVFPFDTTHWLTDPAQEANESRPGRFTERTLEWELGSLLSEFIRRHVRR